jgi:predicted metalloendopeptidase
MDQNILCSYFIITRILANYLIWKAVFSSLPLLSRRWREPKQKYLQNTYKDYVEENRSEMCIKQMQKYMPYALGSVYMKKHFNNKDKFEVHLMY